MTVIYANATQLTLKVLVQTVISFVLHAIHSIHSLNLD